MVIMKKKDQRQNLSDAPLKSKEAETTSTSSKVETRGKHAKNVQVKICVKSFSCLFQLNMKDGVSFNQTQQNYPSKTSLSYFMGLKRECFPLGLLIGLIQLGQFLCVWKELKFQIGPNRGGFAYTFVVLIWCESLVYFEK